MEGELLYSGLIKLFQREFCNGNQFSRHNFLQGDQWRYESDSFTELREWKSSGNFNWFLWFSVMKRKLFSFQLHRALPSFGHPLFFLPRKVRSFNKGRNLIEMFRASNLVLTTKTRVIFFHLRHATEEEEEIKRWSLLQRGTLI